MQRLPSNVKQLMVDIGVCHYMLIFEDAQGSLLMFDFGPIGGDVHVGGPDIQASSKQPKSKSVAGEIRKTQVSPPSPPINLPSSAQTPLPSHAKIPQFYHTFRGDDVPSRSSGNPAVAYIVLRYCYFCHVRHSIQRKQEGIRVATCFDVSEVITSSMRSCGSRGALALALARPPAQCTVSTCAIPLL